MKCVRCNTSLTHEDYEGTQIDYCKKCNGIWLDTNELGKIVKTKQKKFTTKTIEDTLTTAYAGVNKEERRSVDRCPKCSSAMKAVNYAYNSGVVIDTCPKGHGVWLDGGEIEKVQVFKEHNDDLYEQNKERWAAIADAAVEELEALRELAGGKLPPEKSSAPPMKKVGGGRR